MTPSVKTSQLVTRHCCSLSLISSCLCFHFLPPTMSPAGFNLLRVPLSGLPLPLLLVPGGRCVLAHLQAEQVLASVHSSSADLLITALEPATKRRGHLPSFLSRPIFVPSISISSYFDPHRYSYCCCRWSRRLLVRLKSARGSGGLRCFHVEQKARNDVVELRRLLRVLRVEKVPVFVRAQRRKSAIQ